MPSLLKESVVKWLLMSQPWSYSHWINAKSLKNAKPSFISDHFSSHAPCCLFPFSSGLHLLRVLRPGVVRLLPLQAHCRISIEHWAASRGMLWDHRFIWLSFQLLCENFLSVDGKVSEALARRMGSWPDGETWKEISDTVQMSQVSTLVPSITDSEEPPLLHLSSSKDPLQRADRLPKGP